VDNALGILRVLPPSDLILIAPIANP